MGLTKTSIDSSAFSAIIFPPKSSTIASSPTAQDKDKEKQSTTSSSSSTTTNKNLDHFRDFFWEYNEEPHLSRRRAILAKHPEIATLFKPEIRTLPIIVSLVCIQSLMQYWMCHTESWLLFVVACYVVGGTINHTLNLGIHELAHNLCFETPVFNKMLAVLASLPTGVPSSNTFRRYHMIHHLQQGYDGFDVDIPTYAEIDMIQNQPVRKLFFVIFQAFFYAIRPMFVLPLPIGLWDVINFVVLVMYLSASYIFIGPSALLYMYMSSLLGNGLHPSAGHFIAEHYVFVNGQETYSYYGPMNFFNFNVGYHNEHHDFPRVPWSRLPLIKKMAPEFYDNLPYYTSYVKVLWQYITDPSIGPFSRVKRPKAKSAASTD